jgi:para-aminobenzoate synthetase component 1
LAVLERLLQHYRVPTTAGVPTAGGAVAALGFELAGRTLGLPIRSEPALMPELSVRFYRSAVDWQDGWYEVRDGTQGQTAAVVRRALEEEAEAGEPQPERERNGRLLADMDRDSYLAAVGRIKHHIREGDVYQVNFAQRFRGDCAVSGRELYRSLVRRYPAPMMAYLECGRWGRILSDSPELFLRVQGRRVETRPIKGTRPRGSDALEDRRLARELQASEKDAAELAMIVDLERNDLGRVAETGSVRVIEPGRLVSLPTVHHLVATVTAELRQDVGPAELLRAAFPGGSISGAPKRSAVKLISELEPVRREIYTGSVGWLGFDGELSLNLAIRTLLIQGGRWYLHSGGGIVADSDPEAEYQETLTKARAFFDLLGVAVS